MLRLKPSLGGSRTDSTVDTGRTSGTYSRISLGRAIDGRSEKLVVQLEHLLGDIVFCRANHLELLPLIERVRVAPKGEFEPAHARPLHGG